MQELSKSHMCHYEGCNAAFDRPYRLQQHLLVHENIKAFQCPEMSCKKAYTSKSHLDRHIYSVHEPDQNNIIYSCPKCLKKFANRQNIKRHMKIAHAESTVVFTCAECRTVFRKKHLLNTHMYTHTGIKAFGCADCCQSFVTLQERRRHMKAHKTYICEDCNLVFNLWSAYQKHKKAENADKEYICDHCQRKFKQRQHILHHMKIHGSKDTVKFFVCHYETCDRKYTRKSNLKQHIKSKHEKVTYNCTICDAKLCTKAKLSSHIMKIHERTDPIDKRPKTKATGRKERKDKNIPRSSFIFKIADIIPVETQLKKIEAAC